jgi:hypothetical protein
MFRTTLSIYLALVTLAGPWLCCCTAARATASLLHSERDPVAPRQNDRPACCQHHTVRHQSATGQQSQPDKSAPRRCPCGHDSNRAVIALDTESARQLQPVPAIASPINVLPLSIAGCMDADDNSLSIAHRLHAGDGLSTTERLHVLQLLRC